MDLAQSVVLLAVAAVVLVVAAHLLVIRRTKSPVLPLFDFRGSDSLICSSRAPAAANSKMVVVRWNSATRCGTPLESGSQLSPTSPSPVASEYSVSLDNDALDLAAHETVYYACQQKLERTSPDTAESVAQGLRRFAMLNHQMQRLRALSDPSPTSRF